MGKDITHWRISTCGRMLSTRSAAVSAMRRVPHEGQIPRCNANQPSREGQRSHSPLFTLLLVHPGNHVRSPIGRVPRIVVHTREFGVLGVSAHRY